MLKKKVLIIVTLFISIIYLKNVAYANNKGVVYLTSNREAVNSEEEIEITVNIENSKVAACNLYIAFDKEKIQYISDINKKEIVDRTHLLENRLSYVWFDELGGKGAKEGNIVSFKFKAKQDGIATFIIDGEFYNQNEQLIDVEFKEVQVKIGKEESRLSKDAKEESGTSTENANTYLQALRVDIEGIVPSFDKNVEEYYLTVPKSTKEIEVLATAENPNASVEVKGNTNLQNGENEINIKVTSADRTQTKDYKIHVTKTDNLELANTNLEILAVQNVLLNPPFEASHTNYEIEVPHETEDLKILAIPENEDASVKITGKDGLKEGENLVTVEVKAKNGVARKIYILKVNRRNAEEEKKYEEEQAKQREELENAYNIEKTSLVAEKDEKNEEKKQEKENRNAIILGIIFITLVFIAAVVFVRLKK